MGCPYWRMGKGRDACIATTEKDGYTWNVLTVYTANETFKTILQVK